MKEFLITLFVAFSMLLTGCSGSQGGGAADNQEAEQTATPGSENLGEFVVYPKDGVIEAPTFGFKMTLPDSLKEVEDSLIFIGFVQQHYAYGRLALLNEQNPEDSKADLVNIVAYPEEQAPESLLDEDSNMTVDMIHSLGTNGTLNYYGISVKEVYDGTPDYIKTMVEDNIPVKDLEKYWETVEKLDGIFDGVELLDLTLPAPPSVDNVATNELLDLTVLDLEGNEVRLGDYIENNKVTILNFWGTFCGPCVMEMPDLQQLGEKYKDQGVGVVGLTVDILDENGNIQDDLLEDAHDIINRTGVQYPILIATPEVLKLCKLPCNPTTFIVGPDGEMLIDPIFGGQNDAAWEKTFQSAVEALS